SADDPVHVVVDAAQHLDDVTATLCRGEVARELQKDTAHPGAVVAITGRAGGAFSLARRRLAGVPRRCTGPTTLAASLRTTTPSRALFPLDRQHVTRVELL